MQFNPVEVSLNLNNGSSKEITEETKLPVFREARKTMTSSQNNHPESSLININIVSSGISAEAEYTSNIADTGFAPVVASSNSISFRVSENKFQAAGTEPRDSINSSKQARGENSLKLTYEQKSDRPLSSQTEINSLENERRIYRKRRTEREDSTRIDSRNIFIQTISPAENLRCEISDNAGSKTSTDERKMRKNMSLESLMNSAIENTKEKLDCTNEEKLKPYLKAPQIRQISSNEVSINLSSGNKSVTNLQQFSYVPQRQMKPVRFLDKENANAVQGNKTHLRDVLTPRRNFEIKRPISRILIQKNRTGSYSENSLKGNKVFNISLARNHRPGNCDGNTHPVRYQMPPPPHKAFKATTIPFRCSLQTRFPQPGVMGTATRRSHQNLGNLRVIFPQMRMQSNLAGNSAKQASPFTPTVDRNETKAQELRNPLEISSGNETNMRPGNIPENTKKSISFRSPTSVLNRSSNPKQPTSSDRMKEINVKNTGVQSISNKENKSNDKIHQLVTTLTKISKVLQNVNKLLLSGFECPGLELSLPIWRTELEQCILSAEKVKKAILEYQVQSKQHLSTPEL